nr:MAG TPA: hypothetical protein [Caudoviricetes sp.]
MVITNQGQITQIYPAFRRTLTLIDSVGLDHIFSISLYCAVFRFKGVSPTKNFTWPYSCYSIYAESLRDGRFTFTI